MAEPAVRIAVIDDEEAIREVLKLRLENWGYEVLLASDGEAARRLVASDRPDIVISDVVMPELSGLELLEQLREEGSRTPVVLITAFGDVDMAVEAMKRGARDFLTKPLDQGKLKAVLASLEGELCERAAGRRLEDELEEGAGLAGLIGASEPMRHVFDLIRRVASSDTSALITGESGTGKEIAARAIHDLSERAEGPFVAVNAAAMPESLIESELFGHEKGAFTGASSSRPGCFEQASGGTLLLDEIAEMPVGMQPKLLRILEQGSTRRLGGTREVEIDVRVLAATNRDPQEEIEEGRLREDLFYRLNVFSLNLPPLRERAADIPLLGQHFLRRFNDKHALRVEGIREEALERLRAYEWPGNVRELRNVIERSAVLAGDGWIEASDLPPYVRESGEGAGAAEIRVPIGTTAAEAEKQLILRTLEHVDNNKAEAARQLGVDVKTIRNKLKRYGLS